MTASTSTAAGAASAKAVMHAIEPLAVAYGKNNAAPSAGRRAGSSSTAPVLLPLFSNFGSAFAPYLISTHVAKSVPTFMKMLLFFQMIVKPILGKGGMSVVGLGPLKALRTTIALQGAGITHLVLNRWAWWWNGSAPRSGMEIAGGRTNPWTVWIGRLVAAVICSCSAKLDSPFEIRPMLSIMVYGRLISLAGVCGLSLY